MHLRSYQSAAITRLRGLVAAGKRRVLLCAPTGSGKTVYLQGLIMSLAAARSPDELKIRLIDPETRRPRATCRRGAMRSSKIESSICAAITSGSS